MWFFLYLIALVIAAIGYLFCKPDAFCHLTQTRIYGRCRFGRNDEESVGTGQCLRKISADPAIEAVQRKDMAQLFIQNPQKGI